MDSMTVSWWYSFNGPDLGYQPWDEDQSPKLPPGQALWVRTAAVNGDTQAAGLAYNLVAPVQAVVLRWNPEDGSYRPGLTGAENAVVGRPPGNRVQFFYGEREWTPPHYVWTSIYMVIPVRPGGLGLLFEGAGVSSRRKLDISAGLL